MRTDNVVVKNSSIHGKGVFAARNFSKGEVVMHWDTRNRLSKKEYENLSDNEKRYVTFLNDTYTVMQEPERYTNHSCNANTIAENFCDVAVRDILCGEEITSNYRQDSVKLEDITCLCGDVHCYKIL